MSGHTVSGEGFQLLAGAWRGQKAARLDARRLAWLTEHGFAGVPSDTDDVSDADADALLEELVEAMRAADLYSRHVPAHQVRAGIRRCVGLLRRRGVTEHFFQPRTPGGRKGQQLCRRCHERWAQIRHLCRRCAVDLGVQGAKAYDYQERTTRKVARLTRDAQAEQLIAARAEQEPPRPGVLRTVVIQHCEYDVVWDGSIR